jgi:glycerophosphoryl diester phosphodiesterase
VAFYRKGRAGVLAAAPQDLTEACMERREQQAGMAAGRRATGGLDRATFLRPIAHRGLHDGRSRIENTAPAFLAAIERGYGIECDLQAARDGTPMVFHDERLDRLVGASGPIAAHAPASLAGLRYRRLDTPILALADLLELVASRVPLLVEVKANGRGAPRTFLDKIARQARAYPGPLALMSFNPDVVAGLGRLAPTVPRGWVVGTHQLPAAWWAKPTLTGRSRMLTRLLGSAPAGLAFLAVDVRMLRYARAWLTQHRPELALFSWTIRTARERRTAERWADAPIFEGYEA